nr:hypothetical protein [uncultured bacterium]
MTWWTLVVDDLKCGGCETTVEKIISEIEGVADVSVFAEESRVKVQYNDALGIQEMVIERLTKAGYPPAGESTLRDSAMSYLSCMKGRLTN